MTAVVVSSSMASVLASRASTPSKIELHISRPASNAPRRVTNASAVQYVSSTAPMAPMSEGMRYSQMRTCARGRPSFAAVSTVAA